MRDDLGTDLHEFLPERGQRPVRRQPDRILEEIEFGDTRSMGGYVSYAIVVI
jgi:hypothetical protein